MLNSLNKLTIRLKFVFFIHLYSRIRHLILCVPFGWCDINFDRKIIIIIIII